jgi:hypothetical protein
MNKSKPPGDDDKVGYKNPPKGSRFKPGKSGNPKGRPKRPKIISPYTIFLAEADKRIKVNAGGKIQYLSNMEIVIKKLFQEARSGSNWAQKRIIDLYLKGDFSESFEEASKRTAEKMQIIHNIIYGPDDSEEPPTDHGFFST